MTLEMTATLLLPSTSPILANTGSRGDVSVVIARLVAACLDDVDESPTQWADRVRRLRDELRELH
jgi:hypothetical protein